MLGIDQASNTLIRGDLEAWANLELVKFGRSIDSGRGAACLEL